MNVLLRVNSSMSRQCAGLNICGLHRYKVDKTKKKNFYEITSLIYYKPSSAIHTIVTMQFICCMVDEVDKNDFWG